MIEKAVERRAQRRLHRRQPRLGLLPARPLRRGGQDARTGGAVAGHRSRDQRPPRRCLLARRAQARGPLPVEHRRRSSTRGKSERSASWRATKLGQRDWTAAEARRRQRLSRRMTPAPSSRRPPAKINLALHVTGRRADGYHELESLVVFADVGDELVAAPPATDSAGRHRSVRAAPGPRATPTS